MKYLKTYEGKYEDITYGDALRLSEFDKYIKQYIEDNYPEYGYDARFLHPDKKDTKRYITYGKELGVGQAKKILALAKRKKDIKLLDLLSKRNKNIEEVELGRQASKYNL